MEDVLNPTLYRRLNRLFGHVKVSAKRESMIARAVSDLLPGEKRLIISHAGEYYQVCCPYCNDTRSRLYVNHMFGKTDDCGRRMLFLAICYNEDCLSREDNYKDFLEKMDDITIRDCKILKGVRVPEEAREVLPPGRCTLLAELPDSHPAVVYVRSRGFDPDELSSKYQVSVCDESRFPIARNRLIIPVFDGGKLKGWQARYVGELDWKGPKRKFLPPKYFSCPDSDFRSRSIYGFDLMKEWHTGIIVEGPTDKWRMGSMAGCLFGNTMTDFQRRRFVAVFRDRAGVLLLDPEEYESKTTQKLLEFFEEAMPGRFCAVKLPHGTDPGSLSREFLRQYVKEAAAEKGVKVKYKKV